MSKPKKQLGESELAAVRSFSRVPIVMLTSKAKETDKLDGFDAGADDYVTKPFSCPELKARIKAVLGRSSAQPGNGASTFRIGELEIDFVKRRVHFGGNELNLTQTEYQVLHCLAQNPGKVLLHEEILTAVWGSEYRDEYQYLRNYVANLRRKTVSAGPSAVANPPDMEWQPSL